MYKRHTGQVSMLESPEMFGSLPLDPNNDWIKLSKFVPWREKQERPEGMRFQNGAGLSTDQDPLQRHVR